MKILVLNPNEPVPGTWSEKDVLWTEELPRGTAWEIDPDSFITWDSERGYRFPVRSYGRDWRWEHAQ